MGSARLVPMATPEILLEQEHEWAIGPFVDAESGNLRVSIHTFGLEIGDQKIWLTPAGATTR